MEVFTLFSRDIVQQRFAELIFQILHGDILKYSKLATAEDAAERRAGNSFTLTCSGHKHDVHHLPKQLHEKAATKHLPALGAELTVFTQERCLYPLDLPLICLRRTRNPTLMSVACSSRMTVLVPVRLDFAKGFVRKHFSVEGQHEFRALLFVPRRVDEFFPEWLDVTTRHQAGYT